MWPFRREETNTKEFIKLHTHLYWMERRIMANQADLDAKLDALNAAVQTELKQLADAVAASAPALAPQVAKVQAAIDALNSDDPPTA